ncbi:hypothetical protein Bca4012_065317 [Brassica carinata]
MDFFKSKFENLKMEEHESVSDYSSQLSALAQEARVLGMEYKDKKLVKKFLRCLPERFTAYKAAMFVSLNIDELSFYEVNEDDVIKMIRVLHQVLQEVVKWQGHENALKTATGMKNMTAMRTATYTATATTSGKVSDLKAAFQRIFWPICHHCGVVGHIRPRCFKLRANHGGIRPRNILVCNQTGGEVVTFWSKECISDGGEEHGDGRPDVDGAYLMGEKNMLWCTSRAGEKHN